MKLQKIAAVALFSLACMPVAATAQAPAKQPAKPQITQGASVYGPKGGLVGTIQRVAGDSVVVNTGTHSATLATSAFGTSAKGLTITMSQAQLNQAIEAASQAAADKLTSALVVGAPLRSMDGMPMGTIKSINADGTVVVDRESGAYSLKREQFGTDANGLIVRLTAKQLNDAIAATTGTAATATATTASTPSAGTTGSTSTGTGPTAPK